MTVEIGATFGALTVVSEVGNVKYGGRNARVFQCECECGRIETLPLPRLKKRVSCGVCMRGDCVFCGKPIERKTNSDTCSDVCQIEKKRYRWNLEYAKRVSEDPEFNKKNNQEKLYKLKKDPDRYAEFREKDNLRKKTSRLNPELQEKESARQAKRYQAKKEDIRVQRHVFWKSLTEDQRLERLERRKMLDRIAAQNRRDNSPRSEEDREKYNAYNRESYRENKRLQALSELRHFSEKLQEKLNERQADND